MRFFVPIVPSYVNNKFLDEILHFTNWIGFNLFDLMKNRIFQDVKKYGIKETFDISNDKKIFITTTERDEFLIQYYDKLDGLNNFISIVETLDVDLVMGPDWFVYEEMSKFERSKNIMKALLLNQKCLNCDNVVPNIHGTTISEMINFVKPFKEQGKELFVLPGREYFLNINNRKYSMRKFFGFTSVLSRKENLKLIVTGINSPKIHRYLQDVKSFVGLGWLIQARYRRLIDEDTFKSIFIDFVIDNDFEDNILDINDLADPKYDTLRASYNLKKIIQQINEPFDLKQQILGGFYG